MNSNGTRSLRVLLPGWADEASALPHPARLIEPVEVAVGNALGYSFKDYSSIPGAVCLWNASNADSPAQENLVCADPVHLIAGSDDAQLVPIGRLNLTIQETSAFIAELNEMLGDTNSVFLHDTAGQWYYKGLIPEALDTAPTSAVEGHPMTAALPRSDAARPWRSLWSETQMALHGSAVNEARQARGEPVINSVWFWGGGALPTALTNSQPNSQPRAQSDSPLASDSSQFQANQSVLYTDNLFARGLAEAAGVAYFPLQASKGLNLAESEFDHHLILDMSLLNANPDFVKQQELGALWCERIAVMSSAEPKMSAELNGLTGCREVFVPTANKMPSVLTQLSKLFAR